MKYGLLSFLLVCTGVAAGCGDDTSQAGGGNNGGSGAGNSGGENAGGSGGQGVGANFNCEPSSDAPPALTLTEVNGSLDGPVSAKSPPGRPDALFVVEQSGTIRIIEGGELIDTPFLDVSDVISCCGEEGLLGLAFHPDYADNGRFFVLLRRLLQRQGLDVEGRKWGGDVTSRRRWLQRSASERLRPRRQRRGVRHRSEWRRLAHRSHVTVFSSSKLDPRIALPTIDTRKGAPCVK